MPATCRDDPALFFADQANMQSLNEIKQTKPASDTAPKVRFRRLRIRFDSFADLFPGKDGRRGREINEDGQPSAGKRLRVSGAVTELAMSLNNASLEWARVQGAEAVGRVIDPLLQHIKSDWCRGNDAAFNYVLDWMALLVQHPERLPGIAIAVQGHSGSGKSIIVHKLMEIVGKSASLFVKNKDKFADKDRKSTRLNSSH